MGGKKLKVECVATLKVKVVPGATRTEVSGWLGDELKIRVSAQPENGKANAAVEALLAKALNKPVSSIKIVAGKGSQRKRIEIIGLTRNEVLRMLGAGLT